jgi:putative heme-binding domain-containing protein
LDRVAAFVGSEDEATAVNALRLAGHWGLEEMSGRLISLARKSDKNIRKAALGAIAAWKNDKAEKLLRDLALGSNPAELRLLATAQLASLNAPEAARIGVDLLRTLPEQTDAAELFQAFISQKQGTRVLADALTARKIPAPVARAGRQVVERQVPWNRRGAEEVKLLRQALEASGGVLPAERMPQQLSSQDINSLAIQVNRTADPVRGEAVFRKSNCVSCHAIGGAGGLIGPDLSSLGTSSPVETIVNSILYPPKSIKEGYELQRVVKKDGSEMMGYLVSNGASEIVMRDVTGTSVPVAKSQIDRLEKIPGSLMPAGLTAGLEKEEFINLVGFLSKLGESGQFRVPTARFVRRWEAVAANPALAQKIGSAGLSPIVNANARIPYQPIYSKVSGELPVEELPVIKGKGNERYSFVRFGVEVLSKGQVQLAINSTAGITAWVGQKSLKLADQGGVADLPQGIHQVTLAIDRGVRPKGPLSVQIQDAGSATAQTRLVMGQ